MSWRQRRKIAVAGLVVAGVAIGGCGSGDSSGSETSSEPLTKTAFVKQAEEICHQGLVEKDDGVQKALKQLAGSKPAADANAAVVEEAVLPPYRQIIDRLGQLGAPKGDEAEVEKIVEQYEAALKKAEADPAKAAEQNPFSAADKTAEAYGLEGCTL